MYSLLILVLLLFMLTLNDLGLEIKSRLGLENYGGLGPVLSWS